MKYRMLTKKLTALMLSLMMLLSLMPSTALFAAQETGYEALLAHFADDPETLAVLMQMRAWDMIGDDGSLLLDASISVDGEEMTLAEARTLIGNGADLDTPVFTGGINMRLGDIATMLAIEDEVAMVRRILEENSDVVLTEEHYKNMASLQDQLENEGLLLTILPDEPGEGTPGEDSAASLWSSAELPWIVAAPEDEAGMSGEIRPFDAPYAGAMALTATSVPDVYLSVVTNSFEDANFPGMRFFTYSVSLSGPGVALLPDGYAYTFAYRFVPLTMDIINVSRFLRDPVLGYESSSTISPEGEMTINPKTHNYVRFSVRAQEGSDDLTPVPLFYMCLSDPHLLPPAPATEREALVFESGKDFWDQITGWKVYSAYRRRTELTQSADASAIGYPFDLYSDFAVTVPFNAISRYTFRQTAKDVYGDGPYPLKIEYNFRFDALSDETLPSPGSSGPGSPYLTFNRIPGFWDDIGNMGSGVLLEDVVLDSAAPGTFTFEHYPYGLSTAHNTKQFTLEDMRPGSPTETKETFWAFGDGSDIYDHYRAYTSDVAWVSEISDQLRFGRITNTNLGEQSPYSHYWVYGTRFELLPDDSVTAQVESVSAVPGTYLPGHGVPISVTFSIPVKPTTITVNSISLNPIEWNESGPTIAKRYTYWYPPQAVDNVSLSVTDVSGTDLFDRPFSDSGPFIVDHTQEGPVYLVSPIYADAVGEMAFDKEIYEYDDAVAEIRISLNQELAYINIYNKEDVLPDSNGWIPTDEYYAEVIAQDDSVDTIDLYYFEDPVTHIIDLIGEVDLVPNTGGAQTFTVRLYAVDPFAVEFPAGSPVVTETRDKLVKTGAFTQMGVKVLTNGDFEIIGPDPWPSGLPNVVYTVDEVYTVLSFKLADALGFTLGESFFVWSSSDEDILKVGNGENTVGGKSDWAYLYPQGQAGDVTVTLTYKYDSTVSDSIAIEVRAGGPPRIVIPKDANTWSITLGQAATVLWQSNVTDYNNAEQKDSRFAIDVYDGYYADMTALQTAIDDTSAVQRHHKVIDIEAGATPVTRYSIPYSLQDNLLTAISGADPSYTVRISAEHPLNPAATLSALGYVRVISQPAKATLAPLEKYHLDSTSIPISWTIDYVDAEHGAEAVFEITKGGLTVAGPISLAEMNDLGGQQYGGSFVLNPGSVSGLKELYTVTLKAKNDSTGTWSYASNVLDVYNGAALRILVDGAARSDLTMSNRDKAASLTLDDTITQQFINELRSDLTLVRFLSANYAQYDWSQLYDKFTWKSGDNDVASVNYKQGTLYENIENFTINSYAPMTEFKLSGLSDGQALITATHAATGMTSSLRVQVETLKDRFYIMQCNPMLRTQLQYTNGAGQPRTLYTNDEGAIALYEPSGIAGNVYMRSTDTSGGEDTLYLGTIRQSELLSGEQDSTKLQLYPLNVLKLREAARADLFLKKPDGLPFTGSVTLRGGVYVDGQYRQTELLANNTNYLDFADGEEDVRAAIEPDGRLTILANWDDLRDLTGRNAVQFIFEIRFDGDAYQPELVFSNSKLNYREQVMTGDRILNLTAASGGARPLLSYQQADYKRAMGEIETVIGYTGLIGPGSSYPEVEVRTSVLLWGLSTDGESGYRLRYKDNFGAVPGSAAQSSRVIRYPFSSMSVLENTLTMKTDKATKASTLWWDTAKDTRARALTLEVMDGSTLRYTFPVSWRAIDMTHVEDVVQSGVGDALIGTLNIAKMVTSVLRDSELSGVVSGVAAYGVQSIATGKADSENFKMLISPTGDPTIFSAYVWAGKNGPEFEEKASGVYTEFDYGKYESNFIPSAEQWAKIAQGDVKEIAKTGISLYNLSQSGGGEGEGEGEDKGGGLGSPDISYHLNGYYKAEIRYNFDTSKWEIITTGGGFSAGIGVEMNYESYFYAGPVPCAVYVKGSAYATISMDNAVRYAAMPGLPWNEALGASKVNDFLVMLRINGYIRAFGGLGVDYSVVAMRIGIFGQLDVDFASRWLTRKYLQDASQQVKHGQYLDVKGKIGIEAMIKILIFTTTVELVSAGVGNVWHFNSWDDIGAYWANASSGLTGDVYSPFSSAMSAYYSQAGYDAYAGPISLESRSYLDEFDRSWPGGEGAGGGSSVGGGLIAPASLDITNGLAALQNNAYPYSSPFVSADGALFVYVSDGDSGDIADARIMYSTRSGTGYPQGSPILAPGSVESYGVSNLSVDGTADFAAAAWVYGRAILPKAAGEALTTDELSLLINGSEIMAAVYDGGMWAATEITGNNGTPDLAPAIAVNKNGEAIIAWRNTYSLDPEKPLDFDRDSIFFRKYNRTDGWGETLTLYNGSSGSVYALSAAMLPDGTAAVAYVLDNPDEVWLDAGESGYEIVYAVIDASTDEQIKNVRLTNNRYLDENPQLTIADFGGGDYRFVLGWHSFSGTDGVGLASFDRYGNPDSAFADSLSALVMTGKAELSGSFRFARMNEGVNDNIGNLAILWPESVVQTDDQGEVEEYYDVLKGARFVEYGGAVILSAPSEIARMSERYGTADKSTTVDHFDAYIASEDGGIVRAVILGSEFDGDFRTAFTPGAGDVLIPITESKLFTATGRFANKLDVPAVSYDYEALMPRFLMPVRFTVENNGWRPITSVYVNMGAAGAAYATAPGVSILPNQSYTFTFDCRIGDVIQNIPFTVTAGFDNGDRDSYSGELFTEIPDVGVAWTRTVSEKDGKREVEVGLYNMSEVPLKGSGKTVRMDVYQDANGDTPIASTYITDASLSISDDASLAEIDNGSFVRRFTFDIAKYLTDNGITGEIPDSGLYAFIKCWIEETVGAETVESFEYYRANNTEYSLFDSLLQRNGSPVTITTTMDNASGGSVVDLQLQNNSLRDKSTGNVIALLLDESGNVVESMQSQDVLGGFLQLDGEGIFSTTFGFTKTGASVEVLYTDSVLGNSANADLNVLRFSGIPVDLASFAGGYAYSYTEGFAGNLLVTAIPEDPGSTVQIDGVPASDWSANVEVKGYQRIRVTVTAADGVTTKTWTLAIGRAPSSPDDEISGGGSGVGGGGGVAPATVTGGDGSVALTYTLANGIVTLLLPEKEMADVLKTSKNNTAVFEVSGIPGATGVTMPTGAMATFADAGLAMQFKLPQGTVTLDAAAAKSAAAQAAAAQAAAAQAAAAQASQAAGQAGGQTGQTGQTGQAGASTASQDGGTVTVRINPVKYETLTEAQKEAVQPDDLVFDISVFSGSTIIKDFGGGTITVTLPYDGPRPVAIWYLRADGELERLICQYNELSKTVSFIVNHLSLYVLGQGSGDWIKLTVGELAYGVNDSILQSDVAPVIIGDRTMVPLRFVAEALDAVVTWYGDTRTATVELDGKTLSVTIGELAPGMDVPAMLVDDRTLVPLRYVSEALGCDVLWEPTTGSVEITR